MIANKPKKVIVISGGSDGLGRELAKVLCQNFSVVCLSNNPVSLKAVATQFNVEPILCDITDLSQIQATVAKIKSKFLTIDTLINNAGIICGGEFATSTTADAAKVLMVNTLGAITLTREILPLMQAQQAGKIININSVNGLEAKEGRAIYAASKWGLAGFTDVLRKEVAKDNILVLGIYPGLMATTLHESAKLPRDMTTAMAPEDVAKIIEFLHSFDTIAFEKVVFRHLKEI